MIGIGQLIKILIGIFVVVAVIIWLATSSGFDFFEGLPDGTDVGGDAGFQGGNSGIEKEIEVRSCSDCGTGLSCTKEKCEDEIGGERKKNNLKGCSFSQTFRASDYSRTPNNLCEDKEEVACDIDTPMPGC
jgi:hypothetical protein